LQDTLDRGVTAARITAWDLFQILGEKETRGDGPPPVQGYYIEHFISFQLRNAGRARAYAWLLVFVHHLEC
jgi:hypothetical protein